MQKLHESVAVILLNAVLQALSESRLGSHQANQRVLVNRSVLPPTGSRLLLELNLQATVEERARRMKVLR